MPDKQALLDTARQRFKRVCEVESQQRKREIEDLRFQVPEMQWDEDAKRARLGAQVSGVPTPPRPILSIPKLDQPIQLVLNQERSAHLGVNIHPLSPDAEEDTAEVLQGLYRQIERDSRAGLARSWAFDRAVKAGRGCYRVTTRWADEEGAHPLDQVIRIERILYQDAVYFDPAAQEPDFSDAQWAFVTSWVPRKRFKEMYPEAALDVTDELDFQDVEREAPEWVTGEGDEAAVLVAEYFYKTFEEEKLVLLQDGRVALEGDLQPEDVPVQGAGRTRQAVRVKWAKLTATDVLEEADWNGKHIPLIPVIGRELQPFDERRRWYGMIHPAKDAQRLYNYAASSAVEMAALEPKAPWVGAVGQFEGLEGQWQESNTRNFPYLEYNPMSAGGQPVPPPQRAPVDLARLGPSMQLLQQADNFIQSATATFDPALGNLSPRERSGKAILALQQQADAGNSDYLQNMVNVSMTYEARVVLDLIPAIYDRPGRLARVLDTEDESSTVALNAPFVTDPRTKRPQLVPEGVEPPPEAKMIDLQKGIYAVSVDIGRSYQTRLQEGADEIGRILEAQPNLMPLIGSIYFKYRDFPGANEIADVLRKVRDATTPALQDDEDIPTLEAAQAQVAALKQQIQQMQQQLQGAAQAVQTDQAKQQATLQKTQADNQTKLAIAQMEAQTKILLAELEAKLKQALAAQAAAMDEKLAKFDAAHETALEAMKLHQRPEPAMHEETE